MKNTAEQVTKETVAPEVAETPPKETTEAQLPAPQAKTYSEVEYKGLQKTIAAKDREIEATKSQLSAMLRQGQDTEAVREELAQLRLEVLGLRDAYDGIGQTTEEVAPAVQSRVAKFQAEREAAKAKTQPQSMTEPERAAETIRALVKKAKIEPTDPMLASVSETWNAGNFTDAVEDVRILTSNIISATKALEEEGLSFSSDEAKKVRDAIKSGNTRKINKAVEELIDKKVAEDNAAVEAENERKAGFKVNTVTLQSSGRPQSLEDLRKVDTRGMSLEQLEKHKAAYKAALNRR